MRKIFGIIIIIVISLSCLISCNNQVNKTGFVYGTTYEIELSGNKSQNAYNDIIELLNNIEATLSTQIEGSDVYTINNSVINIPIEVSELTISMFEKSLEIYNESQRGFNPAIYPIVKLWGFSPDNNVGADREVPNDSDVSDNLAYCYLEYFEIDNLEKTVTKISENAQIDFGGIAKGYAVQESLEICRFYEVEEALINIGGNVGILGDSLNAGVKSPRESEKICFASFTLNNGESVATSGDYEKYFINNDVRYHHIMDSDTGRPVDNGIIAVTIVTSDGTMSDALSTAVFSMGVYDGMTYASQKGAKCLIIMDDNTYYTNFDIEVLEEGYTEADINEAF